MTADRKSLVASSTTVNGIDHVQLGPGGATITVFFINQAVNLSAVVTSATLTGGLVVPSVPVASIQPGDWKTGPLSLTLHVTPANDPSTYTLTLVAVSPPAGGPALDPYFTSTQLSFAAGTTTTVDCETPPPAAAAATTNAPPIDYLAKDFLSFRNALLGFSALRYPAWQERSEADFGVMFMEALCSLADDLSYQQDRIANEAYLDTATERRSLVRLARLVGYEPQPPLSSSVTLAFTVTSGTTGIQAGLSVSAGGPDGTAIPFETGTGLADTTVYPASSAWSTMKAYVWDQASPTLPAGATDLWVSDDGGAIAASLKTGLPASVLLDTTTSDPTQPIRQIVAVAAMTPGTDPLTGKTLVHVVWDPADALTTVIDLRCTTLNANLVPATQGLRHVELFSIGSGVGAIPPAIERIGPNQTTQYLYTLGQTPLAWLPSTADPSVPYAPEIQVSATQQGGAALATPAPWTWHQWLLDAAPSDTAFTLDPMSYAEVGVDLGAGGTNLDYDGDNGTTVRFGDDSFGQTPATGTVFQVLYRAGGGAVGNVAADSITTIPPGSTLSQLATAVTNPFAATGGTDEETSDSIQRLAPEAYKTTQITASLPADFQAAAGTLSWVAQAGSTARYTGSWLTTFTAAAPAGADLPTDAQTRQLVTLLDRVQLVGREPVVVAPAYLSLDIVVVVDASPGAFSPSVQSAVLAALGTGTLPNGTPGFFRADQHTFGEALERSALEAAVQGVPGVAGVIDIQYRRAGSGAAYVEMPNQVQVGAGQLVRVQNDPGRPDAGSLAVTVEGGR